jgi:D-beta-D-heptose 7-phosphate kinase/D-beta-D-heptose 1-phosphate adenosyltransferase
MNKILPNFSLANVLVIGDVMLDRYMTGGTQRISPEAPVPVVNVASTEDRPGGAANVAQSIVALGGKVKLIGLTGDDEAGAELARLLAAHAIDTDFVRLPHRPTIMKLRVLSRGQQLIRLDFEARFQPSDSQALLEKYAKALVDCNVVVLSDYDKGTLADAQLMIELARKAGVKVLVDPKGSDFIKYRGASLITPNLSEFEAVVGTCLNDEDLVAKAQQLILDCDLEALLVTRSEKGMTLVTADASVLHLPTTAVSVSDVTGAGDTVISMLATALSAGENLAASSQLANIAAGIVVTKVGTSTVNRVELRSVLAAQGEVGLGILSKEQLLQEVEDARGRGESIVMSNGCFDLLHAGHVSYLQSAAALGDRLIIAVNSDASVKRLKGDARPINHVLNRMKVLASLAAVDWVIEFTQDTPEDLINAVLPDVLVKGGDYKAEEIVGYRQVIEYGGEVKILQFEEGCSTTETINIIKGTSQ